MKYFYNYIHLHYFIQMFTIGKATLEQPKVFSMYKQEGPHVQETE